MGQTKTNFSDARLSQARTVLAHSTDLARAVLAGTKALDGAYGEAKKAKQQLDGKGVAKTPACGQHAPAQDIGRRSQS